LELVASREVGIGAMTVYPELPGLVSGIKTMEALVKTSAGDPHAGRSFKAWALHSRFKGGRITISDSVEVFSSAE
jgi:hypothetical protein